MQNIKATFPAGVEAITVHGLHQWDYGRQLEITATGLPSLVEVHFACPTMTEAVVRSCSVTNGTLTAAIPDICLEQTAPVVAWVYEVGTSAGSTILTVMLPIIKRARPQPNATIPTATSDKYTEAVAAMNTAINNLTKNNVTVARAIADESGNNIQNTYATVYRVNGTELRTDILAKADELADTDACNVYQYYLGGTNYEVDETGKYKNLPNNACIYCRATIFTRWGNATIWLWGANGQPNYYTERDNNSKKWSEWKAIVDSSNISQYAPTTTPQLVGSITLTDGRDVLPFKLEYNSIYIVRVKYVSTNTPRSVVNSGIMFYTDGVSSNVCTAGEYIVELRWENNTQHLEVFNYDNTLAAEELEVTIHKMGTF